MGDDALAPIFPDIHPAERRRFLAARDGNLEEAVEMLRSHLSWRSAHELAMANTEDPPPLIGSKLCAIGLNPPPPTPLPPPVTPEPPPWSRPEFAWAGGKAKDGSRCVCLRCCLIDLTLGSCEQYVLAFSAFLDGLLDRSSDERLTVLVDNRPGDGAPNVPGIKLLPLGQQMSRTLSDQCAPPARNRA